MLGETVGWLILLLGGLAYGAAWAYPPTRPYARKFWHFAVVAFAVAIGLIVLRKRPGRDVEGAKAEGEAVHNEAIGAIDGIVDRAREGMARADAELAVSRAESEKQRAILAAKLDAVSKVEDSMERRKALIEIAKG